MRRLRASGLALSARRKDALLIGSVVMALTALGGFAGLHIRSLNQTASLGILNGEEAPDVFANRCGGPAKSHQ